MKQLILHIAKQLVDNPDKVDVEETQDGDTVKLMLRVAEDDKGKIIGKQGKVIKALRAITAIPAAKTQRRIMLDLE